MKMAIPRPRVRGSPNISAKIPTTVPIGALANVPENRRNTRKKGQFGESAQARVLKKKAMKV